MVTAGGVPVRVEIDPDWWVSGSWEGRPIRDFLERRDVTAIFRFLHARGVSYGAIGGLVGISPNRAAEIARNLRQVTAYEVLERVAVGLRIPRAVMGLGHEPTPAVPAEPDAHASGLAALRAQLDETLASSTVTANQLEMIEEATHDHVRGYLSSPPLTVLRDIAAECAEVLTLSRRRQPAAVQARLSAAAALLAALSADALLRLGDATHARLWYRTAAVASDDSGQPRLRVLVRTHAAMLPYYFGDPRQTVALAEQALALSTTPCPLTALAAAARARALARIGATEQAKTAMVQARHLFDQAGETDTHAAFEFPARRLLFYLSGTAAWAGDLPAAYRLQDEALTLYRASPVPAIDPALIQMDRSMCLAREHRTGEAAAVAREAVACLPEPQRTEIVLSRARDVVAVVPADQRQGSVAELDDYLRECGRRAALP
ncbi:hypothetical protein [Paractinoplanes brasiliensis]|uniref:hypothetical protein n=1 Tax=Paractinoplanes brasiliensis TaxID=52695 RepID=UPI001A579CE7|nr:hypothetical protein [Actinoplanes brasiliensis]GID29532.1 hypothetical protein Abr02nite_45150 [Actinoplanes brasiliensis]